jgi:UDP-N-acetylglucosamine 2-epimerase
MPKPVIACVVGTRPEAIKMAPLVQELRRHDSVETRLISTGQHREMLTSALEAFGLAADDDLAIMQHGQTLAGVTSRALEGLDRLFDSLQPSFVLGQGDTTTVFVASLLSFYRRLPFGHVEAGLRTDTIDNPFPEEFNRRATGLTATIHFPPTVWAADNLRREGHLDSSIFVTGNTGIDAVLQTAATAKTEWFPDHEGRVILLTTHRRENWGEKQEGIARTALQLIQEYTDTLLVVPMHKNPQVRETLTGILAGHDRVRLIEPPDYGDFVPLMKRASLILSDSGGVQEEAPAFGIPVLVLRDTTERPEGVTAGTARLVGTNPVDILSNGRSLLSSQSAYDEMAKAVSPYGDGHASQRIRYIVLRHLGQGSSEEPMWI